ncbi:MAG: integrase, partial [Proteobacteria bacterium]|nr:integrase [Pseudomonadota bacterium]
MNPALIDALLDVQRQAHGAGHGRKCEIYNDACQRLGMSRATLLRKLGEVAVRPERKRRADAGRAWLTRDEAV